MPRRGEVVKDVGAKEQQRLNGIWIRLPRSDLTRINLAQLRTAISARLYPSTAPIATYRHVCAA